MLNSEQAAIYFGQPIVTVENFRETVIFPGIKEFLFCRSYKDCFNFIGFYN
jgi:hypothetical protein